MRKLEGLRDSMRTHVFAVLGEPYCLWEHPLDTLNVEFLDGFDAGYFKFVAEKSNVDGRPSEEATRAAVQLRLSYHHALETFFSLVGALIQAPTCVYGWLAKCKTEDLRALVEAVSSSSFRFPKALQVSELNWRTLSEAMFSGVQASGVSTADLVSGFEDLWAKLAQEFVSQSNIDEYNSLKHGFRVRAGGFKLEFGIPEDPSVPDGPVKTFDFGGSHYGSSYLRVMRAGGEGRANRSLLPLRQMVNWSVEQTRLLLELISYSIHNVVSFLKLANGAPANTVPFIVPDATEFNAPWEYSVGPVGMSMGRSFPDAVVRTTSREELSAHMRKHLPEQLHEPGDGAESDTPK
ncbi:hypothetical protein RSP673_011095 [Ralstonia solanacearum P673]|uniref:hypothetical protein n=1 Tax=Ralstonia solanacearum TaxID=305 RepID=UPI001267F891|nr:hypothetical protein [Ralstonia solanacearum]MCL9852200.1 hypothetical protein [Ralstonia solanacearum]MCL9857040.1 hypothetical protein [Ralstonia solanacearum]MCL9861855.1 hypothetical protein [Ralstonia solanacearum]MCL9866641.1 hypothetical protein [Ralstonia solanacearum]MCL9871428.1 hypothetical protein [Ralstonia solanacearum]